MFLRCVEFGVYIKSGSTLYEENIFKPCLTKQFLKVFKLWCECGISLETDTTLYLESTEALPKEHRVEESQRNDIQNSYKDTISWELIQSRITRSDNVVSIRLTTTEFINVANNVPIVNETR